MVPPFSMYNEDEEDEFNFRPQQDLNFGLGDLGSALDTGLNFNTEPEDQPALLSAMDDTAQGFGVGINPQFNKSRGLIESSNEEQLSRIRKLTDRALNPNYQISPGEAFATTVLSILPAAAGYMMGGPELAAQTSRIDGGSAYLKNLDETDRQERAAAMQAAQLESQNYRQGVQQQGLIDRMNDNQGASLERLMLAASLRQQGKDSNVPQQIPESVIIDTMKRTGKDREYVTWLLSQGKNGAYSLDTLLGNTGAKVKSLSDSQLSQLANADSIDAIGAKMLKESSDMKSGGLGGALKAGKAPIIGSWYSDPASPEYRYYAQAEALKKIVASTYEDGKLTDKDVEMFAPLTNGSILYDTQETRDRRINDLINYAKSRQQAFLDRMQKGNRNVSGFTNDPLMQSLIQVESSGNPNAVSSAGAFGFTGLMPAKTPAGIDQVAEMWGVDAQQLEAEARRSPEMQVKIGKTYLYDYLLPKFDGDMKKALQAYNGGETRIAKGIVPQESRQYADKVLALTERLKELEAQRRAAGR